jgi:hypothetical protein
MRLVSRNEVVRRTKIMIAYEEDQIIHEADPVAKAYRDGKIRTLFDVLGMLSLVPDVKNEGEE